MIQSFAYLTYLNLIPVIILEGILFGSALTPLIFLEFKGP